MNEKVRKTGERKTRFTVHVLHTEIKKEESVCFFSSSEF